MSSRDWLKSKENVMDKILAGRFLSKENSQLISQLLTDYRAHLMIGLANATEVPCILAGGDSHTEFATSTFLIRGLGTGNFVFSFQLPLPTTRGGLSLFINNIIVGLADAEATDYLDRVRVLGLTDENSFDTVFDDGDDFNAPAEIDYSSEGDWAGPYDMSSYRAFTILMEAITDTPSAFDISYVLCDVYYA